jgi:hypothetical protein
LRDYLRDDQVVDPPRMASNAGASSHHPQIGPVKHAMNRHFDSVLGLQHHVFGLAAFAVGIEPLWGGSRLAELRAVSWPTASTHFP